MLHEILKIADTLIFTEFHRTIDTTKNASVTNDDLVDLYHTMTQNREIPHYSFPKATQALSEAVKRTSQKDIIIVTGSLYLVGEVRELLTRE